MGKIVLIALGGSLGAVLRYFVGAQTQDFFRSATFPFGTLAVNLTGCLVIGFLSFLIEVRSALAPDTRVFLMTGLLGAFTTFSSFSLETFNLLTAGQPAAAAANLSANVMLGLAAVWAGRMLPTAIWR